MTTETPCLPGCTWAVDKWTGQYFGPKIHAEGCPNSPKPAEPQGSEGGGPRKCADDGCEVMVTGPEARCSVQGSEPPIALPDPPKFDSDLAVEWAKYMLSDSRPFVGVAVDMRLEKRRVMDNAARALLALKDERDAMKAKLAASEKCLATAKGVIDGMEREIGGAHVDIMQKVAENADMKARVEELEAVLVRFLRAEQALSVYLDRDTDDEGVDGVEADLAEEEREAEDAIRIEARAIRARKEASNGK